ncbi:MAG: CDP-glucose 4,6-dehydratase, partial [Armatimonadaceae bacterium]
MTPGFWNGKRVVITGHTGFKGSWLTLWLSQLGAKVTGIALEPCTTPSIFNEANIAECCDHHVCDIRDAAKTASLIKAANPEIIFHLAAQPLVRLSYREPLETFASNVMGTANVLNALRECPDCRTAVMITTDKVYHNREWAWPYREDDTLGGHDPYSASKAACEIVINSFRQSFLNDAGVAVASVRAGNVIGGGDWSEDRLIPDAVRAWTSGQTLSIRRPDSVRPWQHVLEPLRGYIELAEKLHETPSLAGAYNFGPRTHMAATV